MVGKSKNYISYRIFLMVLVTDAFMLFLLITLGVVSASEGKSALFFGTGVLLFILINYISYKYIYRPYKENMKVYGLFVNGYTWDGIFGQRMYLNPESELVFKRFKEALNINELISTSKKQAEYLALQNQINPHFLYNTLEGIRGEALHAGLDNVAKMTEALATFFRYTISNMEQLVTLEDELNNIENYYIIQQYRFEDKLNFKIKMDAEDEKTILKYRLPKLTLQPIVENAVYHGIERKIGEGHILIKIKTTDKRLIITVSDDGPGMKAETLNELNRKLNSISFDYIRTDKETKGGIALVNVNRRIKLLFGEEYGICIYSTFHVGTDAEITLPVIIDSEIKKREKAL